MTSLCSTIPSGSGASPASHWRLGPLLVDLEGLLRSHHHDNQSGCRSPFQVSEPFAALPGSFFCQTKRSLSRAPLWFQEREGEDGLLFLPGERVGGGAARGQSGEGAAASVEETDPTVEQSQSRHGLSHPGSVPLPTAAQEGRAITAIMRRKNIHFSSDCSSFIQLTVHSSIICVYCFSSILKRHNHNLKSSFLASAPYLLLQMHLINNTFIAWCPLNQGVS